MSITSHLFDLIKYLFSKNLDTGDRVLDTMILTLFVLTLTSFSFTGIKTWVYKTKLTIKTLVLKKHQLNIIDPNNPIYNHESFYDKASKMMSVSLSSCTSVCLVNKWVNKTYPNYAFPFANGCSIEVERYFASIENDDDDDDNENQSIVVGKSNKSTNSNDTLYYQYQRYHMFPVYANITDVVYLNCTNDSRLVITSGSGSLIEKFLKDVYNETKSSRHQNDRLQIYTYETTGSGPPRNLEVRGLDTIVSKHSKQLETLLDNFKHKNIKLKFREFVSNNLGILLYGPPGTGKTSLIKAICNHLNRNAIIVDISMFRTKKEFTSIFNFKHSSIGKSVFIFEEFDFLPDVLTTKKDTETEDRQRQMEQGTLLCAINDCKDEDTRKSLLSKLDKISERNINKLDLAFILTFLDGVITMEDRVIIATTNHPELINPALLRPGRFDLKICLDKFDEDETRTLLTKLFLPQKDEVEWLSTQSLPKGKWSPAEIIQRAILDKTLKATVTSLNNESPWSL